jgi:DnaJ homolog subfamily C member 9
MLTEIDKVPEAEKTEATDRFKEIAFAYAVLSDSKRRARYDLTGRTSETLEEEGDFSWAEFYKSQFAEVITEEAIQKFKKEYQGGEEEKMAVIEAYVTFEGDMDAIFEEVMLSNPLEDEKRFRAMIDAEIEEKRVEAYPAYVKETKTKRKRRIDNAKKEEAEAMEMAEEMGVADKLFGNGKSRAKKDDTSGLAALIQQRNKSRSDNFLADLEAKYAPAKKRRAEAEPSEEAFQKASKKLKSKEPVRKKSKSKR